MSCLSRVADILRNGYLMKENLFLDLTPCFGVILAKMRSKPRKFGPSTSKMDQKRVTLVQNCAKFGIFSTCWISLGQHDFVVGSVAYRFQVESEPVILRSFLWHFIVG